ncbi:SpoIIE family protein phosphatase [Marinitoga aeolica]|uniref:SpoIIE family protein phosphatase n=1 Tax=Marinitoga aeolica TaxID=2809031 RepID=A0ABY8PMY1_9BACT|nr:SpoIIE family protein phosphatase [Marinitoga aeolica]WGS63987.1 SpoIIE family protein phosphatase [Marinitoga aeolica]
MIKILIIDENEDHRYFLKYLFSNENEILKALEFNEEFKVYEAKNGLEGIKMAQLYEPNVVILEEKLPEMSGIKVCERLKLIKRDFDIPIIFFTAVNDLNTKERAFQIGASDYIVKPAHPYEILIRVKKHLDFYNTQKKLKQTLENYEKDLKIARNVQKNLLPKIKKINNIVFDYIYISSHNTSGDMLEIIPMTSNKIFAYIYDISGHGVTSALLSIIVKQEIDRIINNDKLTDLKEIILKLEESVKEYFFDGRYFTGIFSIISENNIEYVNLAHREVIFLKNNNIEYDNRTDFPLGVGLINENNINIFKREIDKDTFVIFYTDGILDMTNFTEKELHNIMVEKEYKNIKEIIDTLKEEISNHLDWNFPNDDITVLALKQEE